MPEINNGLEFIDSFSLARLTLADERHKSGTGGWETYICPRCGTPHLHINHERLKFSCKICSEGGDWVDFWGFFSDGYKPAREDRMKVYFKLKRLAGKEQGCRGEKTPACKRKKAPEEESLLTSSPKNRDLVFREYLSRLTLEKKHHSLLRERGISNGSIERFFYKSVPSLIKGNRIARQMAEEGYDLKGVPGFYTEPVSIALYDYEKNGKRHNLTGIYVPIFSEEGLIEGCQIRKDDTSCGGPRYKAFSSAFQAKRYKKMGGAKWAGQVRHQVVKGTNNHHLIITEGAIKASIASLGTGAPAIGLLGIGSQGGVAETIKAMGLPEDVRIHILFDMDRTKEKPPGPQIKEAEEKLKKEIEKAGIPFKEITTWGLGSERVRKGWKQLYEVNEKVKGFDDYLLKLHKMGKLDSFRQIYFEGDEYAP